MSAKQLLVTIYALPESVKKRRETATLNPAGALRRAGTAGRRHLDRAHQ
jgi:hypothetical protein